MLRWQNGHFMILMYQVGAWVPSIFPNFFASRHPEQWTCPGRRERRISLRIADSPRSVVHVGWWGSFARACHPTITAQEDGLKRVSVDGTSVRSLGRMLFPSPSVKINYEEYIWRNLVPVYKWLGFRKIFGDVNTPPRACACWWRTHNKGGRRTTKHTNPFDNMMVRWYPPQTNINIAAIMVMAIINHR